MQLVLFWVFIGVLLLTVLATIWAFLLQAGAFGAPTVTEVPHLRTLVNAVIVEIVGAVVALWFNLFGLRNKHPEAAEEGPVDEYLEKGLTNCTVVCCKGDILAYHSEHNAVIYPANVYFDTTSLGEIVDRKKSTLGLYLSKRVDETAQERFDSLIDGAIEEATPTQIDVTPLPNKPGRQVPYEPGSAVSIRHESDQLILFALTQLEKPGPNYVATLDEETLQSALSRLWQEIAKLGVRGELCMPVIGSGFGRINAQSALAHILLSFRAAAEKCGGRLCDKLIVVVYHDNWGDGRWVNDSFRGLLGA